MAKKNTGATIFGSMLGTLIPLALMLWAGVEATGALRWSLFGWVAFVVVAHVGVLTAKTVVKGDAEGARPLRGDVHINVAADAQRFVDEMGRVKAATDGMSR